MDISGNYTLNAPREQVWDALLDPDLLKRSIPGCESLEQTGDNQYAVRLNIAVAGVKGAYQGTLRLLEAHKPDSYRVVVDGTSARGIVHSDGVVRLEANPAGATDIHYAGQAQLGGTIASLGAQVARGAGNMLMREYFSRMADLLPAMPTMPVAAPDPTPVATPDPTPDPTPVASYEPAVAVPEVEPVSVSSAASAAPMEALSTPAPAPVEAVVPPPAAPNIAPPPPEERVAPPAPPAVAATDVPPPPAPAAAPMSTPRTPVRLSDGSAESQRRTAGFLGVVLAVVAIVVVVVVVFVVTGR